MTPKYRFKFFKDRYSVFLKQNCITNKQKQVFNVNIGCFKNRSINGGIKYEYKIIVMMD